MSYKTIRKAVLAQAEQLASQVHARQMDYHEAKPALYSALRDEHKVTNSHARESLTCDAMARFHTRLAFLGEESPSPS